MKLSLGPSIILRHEYTCYVCRKPIRLEPKDSLPFDPNESVHSIMDGNRPDACISCGRGFDFRKNDRAFKRYIVFVAMHVTEESLGDRLKVWAWDTFYNASDYGHGR